MKKLLSILISCVLIFIPLAARVSAAGEETYGYIHYTVYIFDEIYEFENEKDYKDFLKEIGRDDGLFDDPFGDYQDDGPEIMPGDVDGDGEITAADARFVLRYCAKLEILTDIQMIAADVNGDGGVTAADARKILRIAAKLDGRQEDENARQLTGQYNAYLQNASNAGLIPENIHRYLEEYLTYGDFIDFLLNFAQIKCGINAADILKKARAPETSEAQAKVNAVNTVAKIDYKIKKDSDLKKDISAGEIINLLSSAMRELTVPLSPLFVSNVRPDQYKFTNHPKAVCHKDVLTSLLNEIAEQSSGGHSVRADAKDNITRGQFAAYLYKLSMMSLPKDLSGKYLGGVSGDRDMDGFIAGILDKAITKGMTDEQKVKAIYDCLIFNFRHEHIDSNFEHYNYASMSPIEYDKTLAYTMLINGSGTCVVFAATFRLLALRLGFECNYVSGFYVNRDGTKNVHSWNQIKIDDGWHWIDVDVEGQVFYRDELETPLYYLLMKKDRDWLGNHEWDRDEWPAADNEKYPTEMVE